MFERVLVVAPHPDDDAIACSGLLQRAREVRVLFVTDGERNPWPQHFRYRKLFIDANDRARWAAVRRAEARNAMARLGLSDDCARFLGFADQSLMSSARRGDRALLDALEGEIREFQPALIVSPSSFDAHYDHRAIAWYVHQVVYDKLSACRDEARHDKLRACRTPPLPIVTYVVHGDGPQSRVQFTIELTADEQACKRDAIRCHESQLLLGRDRFLSYATPREQFYRAEHDVVRVESWLETMLKRVRHAWFVLFARRSHGARPSRPQRAGVSPGREDQSPAGTLTCKGRR
ncbi:MAG TPA: PIG-L family deacetylase [Thermoanaerobaculia bacterium]|nr:PIG-L family deacetylase [Thermoanaerobaculia bacterium]